jgi:hypothetical protein
MKSRLPEDLQAEFEAVTGRLRAELAAARTQQQAIADTLSAHEAAINELQSRTHELGQANANQARLLTALSQPGAGGGAEAPIILPTGRPLPTIGPPTAAPSPSPTPSSSPSPAPSSSPAAPPAATPVAIASAFQQAFAALQGPPGSPGPTIRSMDVQVKGLVQVASDGSQTTLTFPTLENPIGGDVLSTVSMSLGAVPDLTPSKPPS